MTTGQKLVGLSGLLSGSALAHLLAITQGRTVFASRMTVCVESRVNSSSTARKTPAPTTPQHAAVSAVVPREHRISASADNPRALYSTNEPGRLDALMPTNTAFVLQKRSLDIVVTTRSKTTAATGGA